MYKGLQFFNTASALARHASDRQHVIARNVAHSDTPGYAAQDIPDFADAWRPAGSSTLALKATRPGHDPAIDRVAQLNLAPRAISGDASPNGNTVSIETEMVKSSLVRQQHDLALAAYRGGVDLLRSALGRR
jgi:flagellar basal-body rod protein FlgB